MTKRTPTYLTLRNGIYYFQVRTPPLNLSGDYATTGKLYRRSTKTGDHREALKKARMWWVELVMSEEKETLRDVEKRWESEDEMYLYGAKLFQYLEGRHPRDVDGRDVILSGMTEYDKKCMNFYVENRTDLVRDTTVPMLTKLEPAPLEGESLKLSEVLDLYVKARFEEQKAWRESTKRRKISEITLAIELLGDPCGYEMTKALVRDKYRNRLSEIPYKISAKKQLYYNKDGSRKHVDELVKIAKKKKAETLNNTTMGHYAATFKSFLSWAYKEDYIPHDCGVILEDTIGAITKKGGKQAFTEDELRLMVTSDEFTKCIDLRKPQFYWSVLIAMYSGARESEICQLHIEDVIYDKDFGVWLIDFNARGEKELKNGYSRRIVPLHPYLENLGFLRFREQQKKLGYKYLFPKCKPPASGGQWGRTVGRWFNGETTNGGKKRPGFKHKCGIIIEEGELKDFHSFRHTFINYGKQNDFNDQILREMSGHTNGKNDAHEGYKKPYTLENRIKAINSINYNIDINFIAPWPTY